MWPNTSGKLCFQQHRRRETLVGHHITPETTEELKTTQFEPEYAGKLNFYLAAVDDLLRHPDDEKSIGLLLCKSHDRIIVEYALSDTAKPIGVAGWTLTKDLPPKLVESLPTVEMLEEELAEVSLVTGPRSPVDPIP